MVLFAVIVLCVGLLESLVYIINVLLRSDIKDDLLSFQHLSLSLSLSAAWLPSVSLRLKLCRTQRLCIPELKTTSTLLKIDLEGQNEYQWPSEGPSA